MKKLIIALGFLGFFGLGVNEAQAVECTYLLKNSYGQTQKVINGHDYYSMQSACMDAKRGCENEINRSYSYGLYCVQGNNGGNSGGGYGSSCTVDLKDRWGYRLQSFYSNSGRYGSSGPSACRDALRDCNRYKIDYNYHSARCETRR